MGREPMDFEPFEIEILMEKYRYFDRKIGRFYDWI